MVLPMQEALPDGGRRDWMTTGSAFTDTADKRTRVLDAAGRVAWFSTSGNPRLPAMPALAIQALIQEFRMQRVSAVGYGHDLAPYTLLSVEAHAANGLVRLYALDRGSVVSPLFVDFYATGTTAPPLTIS